jgi:hypothetical protein
VAAQETLEELYEKRKQLEIDLKEVNTLINEIYADKHKKALPSGSIWRLKVGLRVQVLQTQAGEHWLEHEVIILGKLPVPHFENTNLVIDGKPTWISGWQFYGAVME